MSEETQAMQRKTATMRVPVALIGAIALFAWLVPASGAQAAAPAWQIVATSFPTDFAAGTTGGSPGSGSGAVESGPGYLLVAKNVGGAETSGGFTITDTLPAGIAVSPIEAPSGRYGPEGLGQGKAMTCENSGQTVSCSGSGPLYPGQIAEIPIFLEVPLGAPGTLIDEATVEGGGASPVSTTVQTAVTDAPTPFGFIGKPAGAHGVATNADGSTATQAGSHPYQLSVAMEFTVKESEERGDNLRVPGGGVRDISGELPQGVVVNPAAAPQCTEAQLESQSGCPDSTQIGTVQLTLSIVVPKLQASSYPLYNMVPPPGTASVLGLKVEDGIYIHLLGRVRSGGDYGLSADVESIGAKVGVMGNEVTLWGDPTDQSHDFMRGECVKKIAKKEVAPGVFEPVPCEIPDRLDTAFVTMPSACSAAPIDTVIKIDNWVREAAQASYGSADTSGNPSGIDGCNQLAFEPKIEARPTTNLADSPSGLEFNLHQPQEMKVDGLSTANLKNVTVALPTGMAVNPSSANGLGACTEGQLDQHDPVPAHCPDDSKIGSVEAKSPLLESPLTGAVYLAKPYANPFNSLLAIYIAVEDPKTGIVAKLPGKVVADPNTGQLTTTVQESPELPIEDVKLKLFAGPRAALRTPISCATYTTTSDLTPWSTPEGANAHPSDSFATSVAANGGACPASEAAAPNHPSFSAGTVSPQAGAYSPFLLKVSREDGSQRLAKIEAALPKGLSGKLAGIAYCSEAQIAAAKAREAPNQGAAEIASPSCPASSEVGQVDVGAGAGITPYYTQGHAYLAGPYKGAPLSMVIITPAVAGPFDLGAVVVRNALYVDPETAQIHAVSDPLPQIIDGIPLDVRSVAVRLGRPAFTLNPTSCDPSAVGASLSSNLGQLAPVSSPFQVGGCSTLPFKPKISISLKGGTKRGGHPALTAIATAKPGEANIGSVSVAMPPSEFIDQSHIKTICTRVQFAAHACPTGAIYGKARATTPLLDGTLTGPVYLRSSSHQLPDLVVALKGPASQPIEVVLAGRVDTFHKGIRNSFEAVPDAPVTKFVLEMQGGKKGLIENSTDICRSPGRATVLMDGQNGKVHDFEPLLKTSCKGGKKAKHKKSHK
jgi:hypothetical protein